MTRFEQQESLCQIRCILDAARAFLGGEPAFSKERILADIEDGITETTKLILYARHGDVHER